MLAKRSGFTLMELLVVIAIIGILASLVFPLVLEAKVAARRTSCLGNLKQLGGSIRLYQQDFAGSFPGSATYPGRPAGYSSWVVWLSGYVRNKTVFNCPAAVAPWTASIGGEPRKIGYSYNEYINFRSYGFTNESTMRAPSQVLLLADGHKYSLMHDWSDGDSLDQIDLLPSGINRIRFSDMRVLADGKEVPMVRHGGPNVLFCDMHARQISARSFRAKDYPGYSHPATCKEWPLMYPAAKRFAPPSLGYRHAEDTESPYRAVPD